MTYLVTPKFVIVTGQCGPILRIHNGPKSPITLVSISLKGVNVLNLASVRTEELYQQSSYFAKYFHLCSKYLK